MDLKIVKPSQEWFIKLTKFKKEFMLSKEETIVGSADLHEYKSLSEWLVHVSLVEKSKTEPGLTYLAVSLNGKSVLGTLFLRFNHPGSEGDVDFSNLDFYITKGERHKGYGKFLVRLGLLEFKKLGYSSIVVTCEKNNVYASKAILANYGEALGEVFSHNKYFLRYRINMKNV